MLTRNCFLWVWQLSVQVFVSGRAVPQQEPLNAWNHLNTLRVDLKCIVFPILQSLHFFSWEIVCSFDNNLDLHSLTLENLAKLTYFTIDFLSLFCWSFFYDSFKYCILSSILKSYDQWNLVPSTSAWSGLLLVFHTWAAFNII